jgi:uncharacterized protein YeaO (DUF488 family)
MIRLKRVYLPKSPDDGTRILVDRLWPRGLSKERAAVDLWLKEVAPTDALRKWFDHDPAKWPEFQKRYRAELRSNPALGTLRRHAKGATVTLLYGAKDEEHNDARVLEAILRRPRRPRKTPTRRSQAKTPSTRKSKPRRSPNAKT